MNKFILAAVNQGPKTHKNPVSDPLIYVTLVYPLQ